MSTTSLSKNMRIAIVGAGVSGLTLAAELSRQGYQPQLFEQAPEMGVVGAALFVSANSIRILEDRVHATDKLIERSFPVESVMAKDAYTGETIKTLLTGDEYEQRYGFRGYGIHRAELQSLLIQIVGMENIHLDKRLVGIDDDGSEAVLTFADGSTHAADLVIAGDGVRSLLRRHVVGYNDMLYSGCYAYRGMVSPDSANIPDHGSMQFWMADNGHALHYPIADQNHNFLVVKRSAGPWPHKTWTVDANEGDHLRDFEGVAPELRGMLEQMPTGKKWAMFYSYPLHQWSRGRVTLMGDAAHAMLPHYGQGANTSIEDAIILADALTHGIEAGEDLRDVQQRYQDLRIERTRKIQIASAATGEQMHMADSEAKERRTQKINRAGMWDYMVSWVHSYDATTAVANSLK
ncbi:FAD-dependent monooxygenase [Corynebacterium sp. S7]